MRSLAFFNRSPRAVIGILVGANTVTARGSHPGQNTRVLGTSNRPPAGTYPGHQRGIFMPTDKAQALTYPAQPVSIDS